MRKQHGPRGGSGPGLARYWRHRQEGIESDEASKIDVLGFVDHTHTAAAEFLDDAVVRDDLPHHWAEILGLGAG